MPSASAFVSTVAGFNRAMLRPFRQQVSIVDVALALVLVLVIAGQFHLILERVEL